MNIIVVLLIVSVWSIVGVFWLKEICIRDNNFEPDNVQSFLAGPITWFIFVFVIIYNNIYIKD